MIVHHIRKSFATGGVVIAPLLRSEDDDAGSAVFVVPAYGPLDRLVIPFQNQNSYAYL